MTNYILFVIQEGGFQSRCMLIPSQEFLKVRQEDYDLLKRSSISYTFEIDKKSYIVDNLILQNYICTKNYATSEIYEYTNLCETLTWYACGVDENCYSELKDKEWYDSAICNIASGFNHIKNYNKFKNMTEYKDKKINIIDSFLILELDDGILKMPMYDTVEELNKFMFNHYYIYRSIT